MNDVGIYRQGARAALKGRWGNAVLVTFVATLLGGLASTAVNTGSRLGETTIQHFRGLPQGVITAILAILGVVVFYGLITFVIGGAVELAYRDYTIRFCQGETPSVSTLFSYFHYLGKAFLLRLLTTLYIFLWSLLLVVPGIMAAYSYSMASYVLAQNPDLTVSEAIARSKEIMYGHRFALFILEMTFLGWAIVSALTLGIGLLFLEPYMQMARTLFYLDAKRTYYGYSSNNDPNNGPSGNDPSNGPGGNNEEPIFKEESSF